MTYSEQIFDRYLQQLGYKPGIDYRFNFSVDGNPPVDFYIEKLNPKILVQIKEFNPYANESKRNKQRKIEGTYDAYGAEDLRNRIHAISRQFKPYKNNANYVCIGVVQDHPTFIAFDARDIAEAMYGDVGVKITSTYPNIESHWVFGGNGAMRDTKNTKVSAICSLTSVENESSGVLRDGDTVKCVAVLNRHTNKNIHQSFFSGQRDEVWEINKKSGMLEQINPRAGFLRNPKD